MPLFPVAALPCPAHRMWASVGWGCTAPIAGAVVAAYGLKAAFLCSSLLVGAVLLPTMLLPMEALAKKGPPGASQKAEEGSGRADGGGGGPRLSACSEKLGGKASGASSVGEEAGGLLSVQVSRTSQPVLLALVGLQASGARGQPSKAVPSPAALEKSSWYIGSQLDNTPPVHTSLAFESLLASALDAAAVGSPPPSPHRPLLGPSTQRTPSLQPPCCGSKPLDVAGVQLGANSARSAQGAVAGGSAEVSMWQGIRGLLGDVHVLVFLLMALLMGIGNGAIG